MQRIQRKVGRFMPNRTPNEADIDAMLCDFNDSDQMLQRIEEAAKQWRDAWTNILAHQLAAVEQMHAIYKPLGGKGSEQGHRVTVDTPQETLERCAQLEAAFAELKADMMEEVRDIDKKLTIPAKIARDLLKPMKKAIKLRDDKKVDYERYKSRCEALQNKKTRSDRETTALSKHEGDLARASQEYQYADENLRTNLPRLNAATFSLLPHLLANQIMLQNNLIGNLYTVLNQFSHDQGYPSPPPEPEEVIPEWDAAFTPLRKELEETFEVLRTGKAAHMPMRLPDQGKTVTGLGLRNKVKSKTSGDSVPTLREPRGSFNTAAPRPTCGYVSPRPGSSHSSVIHEEPYASTNAGGAPPINLSSKPSFGNLSSKPSYSNLSSKPSYGSLTSRPKIGASASYSNGNGYGDGGLTPTSAGEPFGRGLGQRRTSTASYASYASSNGTGTTASYEDARDYFGPSGGARGRIPSNSAISPSPMSPGVRSNPAAGKKKPPPPPPPKKIGSFRAEYVTAMYDFTGSGEGDLSFREGDRIKVVKKTNTTQDWWEGEVNGVKGSFPANYCK